MKVKFKPSELFHFPQALLSENSRDDSHWPPELILLREKLTAKSQLEIAQLKIKHEEEVSGFWYFNDYRDYVSWRRLIAHRTMSHCYYILFHDYRLRALFCCHRVNNFETQNLCDREGTIRELLNSDRNFFNRWLA